MIADSRHTAQGWRALAAALLLAVGALTMTACADMVRDCSNTYDEVSGEYVSKSKCERTKTTAWIVAIVIVGGFLAWAYHQKD